jgi:hypothetical protein
MLCTDSTTERAKSDLKGGLKRRRYMCAFIPQKSHSFAGIFGERMPPYIVEKASKVTFLLEISPNLR